MRVPRGRTLARAAVLLAIACLLALLWVLFNEEPVHLPSNPPMPLPALPVFAPEPEPSPSSPPPPAPAPDTGAAPSPPPAPPLEEDGPWSVTVLGPGSEPMALVLVLQAGGQGRPVVTGKDGRTVLPWRPVKRELRIRTGGAAPEAEFVLREKDSVVRFPDLLPLDVDFVDGANALPLVARAVGLVRGERFTIPLAAVAGRFTLPVSPFRRGEEAAIRLEVTPFEGAAPERGSPIEVRGAVSAAASRLLVTVVLRPEARVRVRVEDERGLAAPQAALETIFLDGEVLPVPPQGTGLDGTAILGGVPELSGEKLVIAAVRGGARGSSEPVPLPGDGSETLVAIGLLPPREVAKKPAVPGGGIKPDGERPEGSATMQVTVRRRDGEPAEGIRILVTGGSRKDELKRWTVEARTDRRGVAVVEGLDADRVLVSSGEPGFYVSPATLRLHANRITPVELKEVPPVARTTVVRVEDEQGQAVPCARLLVEVPGGPPYAWLEDGVQFLELLTDTGGIRSLPGLPAGSVKIAASSGSARGSVEGEAGEVLVVTIARPR